MSEESQAIDPYEVVLQDLRAQRDKLDNAIRAIEQIRGIGGVVVTAPSPAVLKLPQQDHDDGPGAFLGMTVVEATKKLLSTKRKTLSNTEIVAALEKGGLVMNSVDKLNTVGSILMRRFNTVGDVVRVSRGVWGLQEWYGSRNFKKKDKPEAAASAEELLGDEPSADAENSEGVFG